MIRKNATLTGIVISLIIVMGMFIGGYLWFSWNMTDSGLSVNSTYSKVYDEINASTVSLDENVEDIRDAVKNVTEPESVYQVAVNGLKGMINLFKLPLKFTNTATLLYDSIATIINLPKWVTTLITISLVVVIIFIIVAIMKGEQKM